MSGSRPYREPGREPAPPPSEAERLGPLRSTHAPAPLRRVIAGPIIVAGVFLGSAGIGRLPLWLAAVGLVAALLLLGGQTLRALDRSVVTLYGRGVVVTHARGRSVVAFDEVNEVWFEVPWLHARQHAYLSGLRLVDFAGATIRVPLTVDQGFDVADAILRGCSVPLLEEATQALKEGVPLTFGDVRVDPSGITVRGRQRPWSDVRLAIVSHARLHLYGRWPLLAWRTLRLDQVPNPVVLAGLVAQRSGRLRFDDPLIVLYASGGAPAGTAPPIARAVAARDIAIGVAIAGAGLLATFAVKSAQARGFYALAVGPVLYGAYRLIRGLLAWMQSSRR